MVDSSEGSDLREAFGSLYVELERVPRGAKTRFLAFSPDGKYLAAAGVFRLFKLICTHSFVLQVM
jgi:hypothetical protein